MRYRYHNLAYIESGSAHGEQCDPVFDDRGKCVVGKGKQIVLFEDGTRCAVLRRCLRVIQGAAKVESKAAAEKRLRAHAARTGDSLPRFVDQWIQGELGLREKGGLIR